MNVRDRCTCGSGKKYFNCCLWRGMDWRTRVNYFPTVGQCHNGGHHEVRSWENVGAKNIHCRKCGLKLVSRYQMMGVVTPNEKTKAR